MNTSDAFRDEFNAAIRSAEIKNSRQGFLRGVLIAVAAGAALYSPVRLWVKPLMFLAVMCTAGIAAAVWQRLRASKPR